MNQCHYSADMEFAKKKESVTSVSGCPQIHFNFDSNMLIKLWIFSLKQNHPFCIYVEVTAWTGYIYMDSTNNKYQLKLFTLFGTCQSRNSENQIIYSALSLSKTCH